MSSPALGRVCTQRTLYVIMTVAVGLSLSRSVAAQSAADKATARDLATEGIGLYQQRSYARALDRLERAESLYDAPVHLLYIARTQAAMGRLVEAAETYRRLARTELGARAPRVFREAIDDGQTELGKLEPRIAGLTISVSPSQVQGLTLSIDGEPVSAAILGARRPTNPGEHRIDASAPGYRAQKTTIELREAETKSVLLELDVDSPRTASEPEPTPAPTEAHAAAVSQPAAQRSSSTAARVSQAKILLGLRLSAQKPAGVLYTTSADGDRPVSDRFGAGGGVELRAGVEFARYFTGLLYVEGYAVSPGPSFDVPADSPYATELSTSPTVQAAGLGFAAGAPPGMLADRLRVFAELGLSILHRFKATIDAKSGSGQSVLSCTIDQSYSGGALRIGAGASYVLSNWLQLGPYVMTSIGRFTALDGTVDCGASELVEGRLGEVIDFQGERKLDAKEQATHALFGIGIAADALIPL